MKNDESNKQDEAQNGGAELDCPALTGSQLLARLRQLSEAVTQGEAGIKREFDMRIPAQPKKKDADLVLDSAADRLEGLEQCARDLYAVVKDVLPQVGGIVLQDYGKLNNGLILAEKFLAENDKDQV